MAIDSKHRYSFLAVCFVAEVFRLVGLLLPNWRKLRVGEISGHVGLMFGCHFDKDDAAGTMKSVCDHWFDSSPGYGNGVAALVETSIALGIFAYSSAVLLKYDRFVKFFDFFGKGFAYFIPLAFVICSTLFTIIAASIFAGNYKNRKEITATNLSVSLDASFYLIAISIIPNIINLLIVILIAKNERLLFCCNFV